MKTILCIAAFVYFSSCVSYKEVQVEMVAAELVRIDTITRFERTEQVLTWRSPDKTEYVSYAALGPVYTIGSKVTVFVRR
jgi:hypothetical protein